MEAGRAELVFDDGAVMVLDGEVSLEIISGGAVALRRGSATTRLDKGRAETFHVQTPAADVVDLGTEFGVRVENDGKTDVVVFDGAVDVQTGKNGLESPESRRRLEVGQALYSTRDGHWERLVSVTGDAFPSATQLYPTTKTRPPVIAGISDNRRAADDPQFYRICHEGLVEDARAFVDKRYEWNGLTPEGLPAFLRGADYVQTFLSDRKDSTLNITVELARPAMLYVLYDNRLVIPEWLSSAFEDTNVDIGLDEEQGTLKASRSPIEIGPGNGIDQVYSVWQRRVENAGQAVVGPIGVLQPQYPSTTGRAMLGIAAQPLHDRGPNQNVAAIWRSFQR
jgi:hypothetical protein